MTLLKLSEVFLLVQCDEPVINKSLICGKKLFFVSLVFLCKPAHIDLSNISSLNQVLHILLNDFRLT